MDASSRSSRSAKRGSFRKNDACMDALIVTRGNVATQVAIKRIIPISSGKGGVGKTTFAINFSLALSRFGKTVLVDLDTGTSAIRNAIDVPIGKDLYHFFRKGASLNDCVTPLDQKLDPEGKYRKFGFVAGPMHLIDEITKFGAGHKARLIEAINGLHAGYVLLGMGDGLDANVRRCL